MRNHQPTRHADYLELVYLEIDGELTRSETLELDSHASRCPECRAIRGEMSSLNSVLDEIKIEAHPRLARQVLDNLPPAAWEMRRPASWRVAAAAFVGLLAAASALTFQSEPLGEALPWIGTLTAMAELFRSAALAGAGLLTASWSGVGLALGEILSRSRVGFVVFGVFVLGVDCLFLRYLWRQSNREALARSGHSASRGASK
jgi:anti-sigma factor RsiW